MAKLTAEQKWKIVSNICEDVQYKLQDEGRITSRIEVFDAPEVQFLGAVRNWPRLLTISGKGRSVEIRQAQAVAVLLVAIAAVVDVGTQAPVLGGLL